MRSALLLALLACSARSERSAPTTPQQPAALPAIAAHPPPPAPASAPAPVPAPQPVLPPAPPPPPPPTAAADEVWLKGTTHVHAKPSGDSVEPIDSVVRWYTARGYDFIALTDHNRVSEVFGTTPGSVALNNPAGGLIVLAGTELTHNRNECEPPGDDSGKCRIHINALGVTARPEGKIEWTDYKSKVRVELYEKAYATARQLGASVVQINHPQYYWGMTPEVMVAIGKGAQLVEIANVQFRRWNAGDATHASLEDLWDAALLAGLPLWGVASDDAHDYNADGTGKYPAGGGWVVVKARRDPQAILAALAAGRFYSSTGVELSRAERAGDDLVVEVAAGDTRRHAITFIENGKVMATTSGPSATRVLPQTGYVRAVVTRDDGKQAWVQPVRR